MHEDIGTSEDGGAWGIRNEDYERAIEGVWVAER